VFSRVLSLGSLLLCLCALMFTPSSGIADDWQPISQEELKMTSVPEAPGAPAVILYRQVDRDDQTNREYNYVRIKILTEEGRKHGDVEIPYLRENAEVNSLKARTIRPDGSIANFEGRPADKTIVKAKGVKYLARVAVLPDVQVGSIIEYHYIADFKEHWVFDSHWILSDEMFTKRAKFSLTPNSSFPLRFSWNALPTGTIPPKQDNKNIVRLEVNNIPAFQAEDYMPPEDEVKSRVDFIYSENTVDDRPEVFWKKEGKKQYGAVEGFINKKKAMDEAVRQIVAPGDSPEVKLQKIYARVQKIKNPYADADSLEALLQAKGKIKENNNVEDVWKSQSGTGGGITWLFLALARAAGLEAYPVLAAPRDRFFFNPLFLDAHRLTDEIVDVKLNGKDTFYDPATPYTPFGILPWPATAVKALRLDKDGGSWVMIDAPDSTVSHVERTANLKLTSEGSLEGKATFTFTGLEASSRRWDMHKQDEAARKTYMENQVREAVPVGIDVDLTNHPDWESSSPTLIGEFEIKVPGWASAAGRRALIPVGLFGGNEKHVFEHSQRVHAIYFNFPTARIDDITIDLPLDWKVSSLPKEHVDAGKVCSFNTKAENNNGTLHLKRNLNIDTVGMEVKYYGALQHFFQTVRATDDEQIVLQPGSAAAAN
jgi:hypothetical protein